MEIRETPSYLEHSLQPNHPKPPPAPLALTHSRNDFRPLGANLILYVGGAGEVLPFPAFAWRSLRLGYGPTHLEKAMMAKLAEKMRGIPFSRLALDFTETDLAVEALRRQRNAFPDSRVAVIAHSYGAAAATRILRESQFNGAWVLLVDPVGWGEIFARLFRRGGFGEGFPNLKYLAAIELNRQITGHRSNLVAALGGHWPRFAPVRNALLTAADDYAAAPFSHHCDLVSAVELPLGKRGATPAEMIADFFSRKN